MDLTSLRLAVRSLVRDQHNTLMPWYETNAFRQLSQTEQASIRALERHLKRANGDIEALLPTDKAAEWC